MRKVLCAIAFGFLFTAPTVADSIAPSPGANPCEQFVCGTPTIEVELGGIGTNTWTEVTELAIVSQPNAICFSDGTCLAPGSIWAEFLYPNGSIGLSSPLTWRPDPPDPAPPTPPDSTVPEPSTAFLLAVGLAILIPILTWVRST